MKIIVIGATGLIGSRVSDLLSANHQVIRVGHARGEITTDITVQESLAGLFEHHRPFDAVVSTAGSGRFRPLEQLTDEDYFLGLQHKLMGQVNIVRVGRRYINDNGSFTLTSGVLSQTPMPGSCSLTMVNAGLEGFVRAAALELARGIRINAVSPVFATETLAALHMDLSIGIPAADFAPAYKASVEGSITGQVLDVRNFKS